MGFLGNETIAVKIWTEVDAEACCSRRSSAPRSAGIWDDPRTPLVLGTPCRQPEWGKIAG